MGYIKDPRSVEERFWDKINVQGFDECWPWLEGGDQEGYGHFWVRAGELDLPFDTRRPDGSKGAVRRACRVAFRLIHGFWPEYSLHGCDNPSCCNAQNPEHVHEGTSSDNAREMFARNRQAVRMRSGESNYRARLTNAQVADIRLRYATGIVSQQQLALEYGVTQTSISRYVRGERYAS